MNHNQQFDEHIKEQFSNFAPDVHPRIWENIMAEKERRKPVGFWISFFNNRNRLVLLGLLIALSTAGTWFYMNKNLTIVDTKVADKNPPVKAEDKNRVDKNEFPVNNTIDQPADASVLNPQNTTTADNNTTLNNNNKVSTNTNTSLSTPGVTKFRVYDPSLLSDQDQNNFANNNTSNKNKHAGNKRRPTGLGSVLIVKTESPDLADDDLAGQGTLLGRLTFNADKISAFKKKKDLPALSFNPVIYLPGCPSIERNAAGNKRYFEIYAGPDYTFRSLKDTGNSVYLQKRKESEKFKSAFSAGIRYTRVFNNSMSVRAGVNYSQINEKFTFTQGNLVQVTYIIDANGDTTGTYLTTGTRYKTTVNKYRSIDVPIVIGYEVGNGKLHANINAGVVVNIYSWQKGDVLDRSLNPVNITTGKGSSPYQFKTNAGVGFIGGVSVYYKLNERMHVMAEPYFRYNFTPMNKETITLKQRYHTAGIRLGIRLDLK